MSILLTAFKGIHNSSYQLVQASDKDKLYLTNSFEGIDRDIDDFDFSSYIGVIMFGLDARLKDRIRIEPKAMLAGDMRRTVYDIDDFADAFEYFNLKATIAKKPTAYLCNYAYYRVLGELHGRALLIHVPPEQHLTDEIKHGLKKWIDSIM